MIPDFDTTTGMLPIGRYPATLSDVRVRFVDDIPSITRADIWDEFEQALSLLSSTVAVRFFWVSGSFISTKPDPDDIDVLFFVDGEHLSEVQQNPESAQIIQLFSGGKNLRMLTELRVDSYVVPWVCNPESAPSTVAEPYLFRRGYWDDFWLRARSGSKNSAPVVSDAYPKRGYVEVMVNGF